MADDGKIPPEGGAFTETACRLMPDAALRGVPHNFEDITKIEPGCPAFSWGRVRPCGWRASVGLGQPYASRVGGQQAAGGQDVVWKRYRQRFPPDLHPSDATVSRVSREMDRRMLCVFELSRALSPTTAVGIHP